VRFSTPEGDVTFDGGSLAGDETLVSFIEHYVEIGIPAGCNFWGQIEPSLASDWEAYLTICGALTEMFGYEPDVDEIPANPAGYEEEGGFS